MPRHGTSLGVEIRRAVPSEMPRAADLHWAEMHRALPHLPRLHTPDEVRRFFAGHIAATCETWVAADGDRLLGFISFRPGLVEQLYVAQEAQRQGLGTALLNRATADGSPRALWTFQANAPANRFYLAQRWNPLEHTDGSRNDEREPDTRYGWPPIETIALSLRAPCAEIVPAFVAALNAGWSPSTSRDVRAAMRAVIDHDQAAFLAELNGGPGKIEVEDGTQVDRLPGQVFWLWDGAFCGSINLRYLPGTEALPAHVSGHIGYSVVPWKQRRGYATRALAALLPHARAAGLSRVSLTCDVGNVVSRRVIEANGGMLAGPAPGGKLLFWIELG